MKKIFKSKRFWATIAALATGVGLIVSGNQVEGVRDIVEVILGVVGK